MKKIFLSAIMFLSCFLLIDNVNAGTSCVYKKTAGPGDTTFWAVHKGFDSDSYSLNRLKQNYADGLGDLVKSKSASWDIDDAIYDCPDKIYYSNDNGWTTNSEGYENEYTKMTGVACYYSFEREHLYSDVYFYVFNDDTMNSKLFYSVDQYEFDTQPIDFSYTSFLNDNGYFCPNLKYTEDDNYKLTYKITSSETADNLLKPQVDVKFNNSSFGNTSGESIKICKYDGAVVEINTKTKDIVKIEMPDVCDTISSLHVLGEVYSVYDNDCYKDVKVYINKSVDMSYNVDCKLTFKPGDACYGIGTEFTIKDTEALKVIDVQDYSGRGLGKEDCAITYQKKDSEGNVTKSTLYFDNKYLCKVDHMGFDCSFNEDKTKKTCQLVNCNYKYKQIERYVPVCGILRPVANDGKVLPIIKNLYRMLKIAIPVLVFALTVVEFLKVLFNGEEKTMKEAFQATYKRLILMAVLIILPFIVEFVIELAGISQNCLQHII